MTKTGKITAKRVLGTSLIYVKVVEDNAIVQEMSVTVQVKPVTYLMLNAMSVFKPVKTLNAWPLGLKVPMELSFHDESGTKFDAIDEIATASALSNRPNRFDTNLIKDGNNSMAIELIQPGFTVLKTMVGPLKDFVIFDVEPAIDPAPKQIGVGDVLILETLVKGKPHQGSWNVKPSDSMYIDQVEGVAVALKSGPARITLDLDAEKHSVTAIDLEIAEAQKIQFVPISTHLTNTKNQVHAVPFEIVSDGSGNLK